MSELKEKIEELKKSRKKLCINTCINLIFGISLLTLFFTSFTEFGIYIFRDLHISIKLLWLIAATINFYSVFRTVLVIKRSKKFVSEIKRKDKW